MCRATLLVPLFLLPAWAQEHVDLSVVDRIKSEAIDRSKVMDTLYQITEVHGPRLTGSPEFDDAAQWTMSRLKEYGLANVHLEHWGPFGRAWSLEAASLEVIEPRYERVSAAPLAWSASTPAPSGKDAATGELILAPLTVSLLTDGPKKLREGLDAYKAKWAGKLRGKIVLLNEPKIPKPPTNPQFRRLTDVELHDFSAAPEPTVKTTVKNLDDVPWAESPADLGKVFAGFPNDRMEQLYDLVGSVVAERGAFFAKEGAAGVLLEDTRAHEGMLFAEAAGSFKAADPAAPPTFIVTAEQYDRIARAVEKKIPLKVRMKSAGKNFRPGRRRRQHHRRNSRWR
jgi:carboxypeptidase Q